MNNAPLILTVAPNGAYKATTDHTALPITPEALAATARSCLDAGAAMLHLHVRHPDGRHSLRADHYRAAQAAIRAAVGQSLVIQVTTEAAGIYAPDEQVALVYELQPEAVSVSLRELLRPGLSEAQLSGFFAWLVASRTMAQVILYDSAEVVQWNQLRNRGVIPEGPWFLLFVLGRYTAGQTSSPTDLLPFLQSWDGIHPWAMCAFGVQEHRCAMAALALGGHVRVGFENNLWLHEGTLAPDNASLVRQVAESAVLTTRPLASAAQVREQFGR